jgi:hypothetical protein
MTFCPQTKPRICLATTMPGYDHACSLDSVLARAFDVRGADAEFLVCDKAIPVCQMVKAGRATPEQIRDEIPIPFCDKCVNRGKERLAPLGYRVRRLVEYVTPDDAAAARTLSRSIPFAEIGTFVQDGLAVGDHARAGALRYFARGDLEAEPLGEPVLRRYLEAGLLTIAGTRRLLETHRYDILVINHGIYIPQGMILEVARVMGVRVVTYNPAYRKHSFIFSHAASYHFTMLDEPAEHWKAFEWTPRLAQETKTYLKSRRFGHNDWVRFHEERQEDIVPLLREIGCNPDKPYVALLTSVVWDAELHYRANAFPNMLDWLRQTVSHWRQREDLQLLIRVHPAEVRGQIPSRQRVVDELARDFPTLPANVFVFGPEHPVSTYALCENADSVIIFNTKAGAEMSALGVPVIVAGEAWIRGKDFSQDVSSPAQYFELLDALPARRRLSAEQQALALRYAYHFFFRRMIPLPFVHEETNTTFRIDIADKSELAIGRWPGLDTICDGVLTGAPFVYRAETQTDPFPGEAIEPPGKAREPKTRMAGHV